MRSRVRGQVICEACGARAARIRHICRGYGKGRTLLIVENVPVVSCSKCGETYLTADTLRRVEEIKRSRITTKRAVRVAQLS